MKVVFSVCADSCPLSGTGSPTIERRSFLCSCIFSRKEAPGVVRHPLSRDITLSGDQSFRMGKPAALWFNELLLLTGHGAGTWNDCPIAFTWDAGEIVDSYHPIVDTKRVGVRPPFLVLYFREELHPLHETLKDS